MSSRGRGLRLIGNGVQPSRHRAASEGRIRAHFETVEVDHVEPGALVRIQPDGRTFDGEREARVCTGEVSSIRAMCDSPNWPNTPASGIAVSRFRPYAAETPSPSSFLWSTVSRITTIASGDDAFF